MFLQAYGEGVLDIHRLNLVLSDMDKYTWQSVCPLAIEKTGNDVLLLLRNAVLVHLLASTGKRPAMVKTHNINSEVNGIHPFPDFLTAGSIYIVRDPRDIAISFAKHLGMSIDEAIRLMNDKGYILRKATQGGFHLLGTWSDNVKSWKNSTVVRYEDLQTNPHQWFSTILEGLGLTVNKPRLGKAIRLCEFERVKKQEKSKRFSETSPHTDTFFHKGTSGHWGEHLSKDQITRIETDHRAVMEQYGYLQSNVTEMKIA